MTKISHYYDRRGNKVFKFSTENALVFPYRDRGDLITESRIAVMAPNLNTAKRKYDEYFSFGVKIGQYNAV